MTDDDRAPGEHDEDPEALSLWDDDAQHDDAGPPSDVVMVRRRVKVRVKRTRAQRIRRRLRRSLPFVAIAVALFLAGAVWTVVQGVRVGADLTGAKRHLANAETALRAGDADSARAALQRAQRATREARAASSGRIWRAYEHLPAVGDSLRVTAGVAATSDGLAHDVLPRLADAAAVLSPRGKRIGLDVDLAPFRAAVGPLGIAVRNARVAQQQLAALPPDAVGIVDRGRDELVSSLDDLEQLASRAFSGAKLVPPMLGGTQPRAYFLAVQNNAEARATGGLLGAFGVVRANRGRIDVGELSLNDDLPEPKGEALTLSEEFRQRYGSARSTSSWQASNLTPDFPTVGRILTSLWRSTGGQQLDGAIALDPVAISYVLEATGPVVLADGRRITSKNVVAESLSTVYARYPQANPAQREAYLRDITEAVVEVLRTRPPSGPVLAERLGRAVVTGHVQVWSTHADEQDSLDDTPIAATLPAVAGEPFLELVTQDGGGSKLDYYLRREVTYEGQLTGELRDVGLDRPYPEERAIVTVRLTNTAPRSGLPVYVTTRADLPPGAPRVVGQAHSLVSLYLGLSASVEGVTLDGAPLRVQSGTERGHSVISTDLLIDPGQTRVLRFVIFQPATDGVPLRFRQQPLVRDDTLLIRRRDGFIRG